MATNHGCMAMELKPKPNHTHGKCFATIEEIKEIPVSEVFRGLKKNTLTTNHGCMAMKLKPKSNHHNEKCFDTIEDIKEILISEVFRGLKKQALA